MGYLVFGFPIAPLLTQIHQHLVNEQMNKCVVVLVAVIILYVQRNNNEQTKIEIGWCQLLSVVVMIH